MNFKLLNTKHKHTPNNQTQQQQKFQRDVQSCIECQENFWIDALKEPRPEKSSSKMVAEDLHLDRFPLAAFFSINAGCVTCFWYRSISISLIYCYISYKENSVNINEFISTAFFLYESSYKKHLDSVHSIPLNFVWEKTLYKRMWRYICKYLMYVLYSIYNISLYKYVGSGGGICNCYTPDPYTLS